MILEVRGQDVNITQTPHDDWNTTLSVPTYWSLKKYPNPQKDIDKCGRGGKKSWVCDPDNILTPEEGRCIYSL